MVLPFFPTQEILWQRLMPLFTDMHIIIRHAANCNEVRLPKTPNMRCSVRADLRGINSRNCPSIETWELVN